MADDKIIRATAATAFELGVRNRRSLKVRRHAWEAHGISFSTEEALAVLLRLELEEGVPADLAMVEETTQIKETR